MLETLRQRLKTAERTLRESFGDDLSPGKRWQAWLHFHLFDHAFLRGFWTNFDRVAEGVYRSNHPGPRRLKKYHQMGIKGLLNLRGNDGLSPWLFEQEAADKYGMELRVAKIYARRPATKDEILILIDALKTMPKPFVMHCKSGADRAGFAAALYQVIVEKRPLSEARNQLHWRYLHLKSTKTGVVDHILDLYEARHAQTGIDMERWFREEYDPLAASDSFAETRA